MVKNEQISKKTSNKKSLKTKPKRIPSKSTESKTARSGMDFFAALLIVSLLFNAVVICIWVVLNVTDDYDAELARILLIH
jgi:hypothetical protein